MTSSEWSTEAKMPVEMESKYKLGSNLWESGDLERAIEVLQDCVVHDPLGDSPSPRELQDGKGVLICWALLAAALLEADRPAEAVVASRRATQFGTLGAMAYAGLAMAHAELGEHAKSVRAYSIALEKAPDAKICVMLADQLRRLGRRDEGREVLLRALELEPEDYWSRVHLGHVCWRMNLNDQAQEHFEAATTILPSESGAQMFLGEFLFFSGADVSRGKECLLKAIELDPENASAQYLLGKALYREENDDEALEYFRRSLHLGDERAQEYIDFLEDSS